ncbi:hypothetical protein, partial [Chelativorans sp. ZYF759]|uniref:hypothetical protein n=1 Tax=Chelativorans sp. ZYF759 TaxID=2692213 RepID=UPI001AED81AD
MPERHMPRGAYPSSVSALTQRDSLLPLWGEERSAAGRLIGNDLSIKATNGGRQRAVSMANGEA